MWDSLSSKPRSVSKLATLKTSSDKPFRLEFSFSGMFFVVVKPVIVIKLFFSKI